MLRSLRILHPRSLAKSLGWLTILLTLCSGISPLPRPKLKTDPGQGWVNVQALLNFTLATSQLPTCPDTLTTSLADGLRFSMALDAHTDPVTIDGSPSSLDSLKIALDNARPDLTHKIPKIDEHIPARHGIFVNDFRLISHPLLLGDAKVIYDLTATDATFDLFQNNQNHLALVMTGARAGTLQLQAPINDLQTFATQQAKIIAGKFGFLIRSIHFSVEADSTHSVAVVVRVNFTVGIVNLKGRMDIDDDMNAITSNLHCDGQGPVGLAVAQLLGPALQDYEGKSRPLVEFPQRKMKLRDIRVRVDDSIHIAADFGTP